MYIESPRWRNGGYADASVPLIWLQTEVSPSELAFSHTCRLCESSSFWISNTLIGSPFPVCTSYTSWPEPFFYGKRYNISGLIGNSNSFFLYYLHDRKMRMPSCRRSSPWLFSIHFPWSGYKLPWRFLADWYRIVLHRKDIPLQKCSQTSILDRWRQPSDSHSSGLAVKPVQDHSQRSAAQTEIIMYRYR